MMPGMGGVDPRQMAMMMRKMGIQMQDIPDVEEVVVRTATKEYRIKRATVSIMKAQGQETWQIQGKAEMSERGERAKPAGTTQGPSNPVPAAQAARAPLAPTPSSAPYVPSDEDVRMVMEQAHCDAATARRTLVETGGDLAEAIVKLS